MAARTQYTAQMTEEGHVSLFHPSGIEQYRIWHYRGTWQVVPLASQRGISRKQHPDPVTAAKAYFGSKVAKVVAETWESHQAEQEPAPGP